MAGSCEGGNEMLIPKNKAVKFFAICETVSQEGLGSGKVKLKLLYLAIYLAVSCGQPSHPSDSTANCRVRSVKYVMSKSGAEQHG